MTWRRCLKAWLTLFGPVWDTDQLLPILFWRMGHGRMVFTLLPAHGTCYHASSTQNDIHVSMIELLMCEAATASKIADSAARQWKARQLFQSFQSATDLDIHVPVSDRYRAQHSPYMAVWCVLTHQTFTMYNHMIISLNYVSTSLLDQRIHVPWNDLRIQACVSMPAYHVPGDSDAAYTGHIRSEAAVLSATCHIWDTSIGFGDYTDLQSGGRNINNYYANWRLGTGITGPYKCTGNHTYLVLKITEACNPKCVRENCVLHSLLRNYMSLFIKKNSFLV